MISWKRRPCSLFEEVAVEGMVGGEAHVIAGSYLCFVILSGRKEPVLTSRNLFFGHGLLQPTSVPLAESLILPRRHLFVALKGFKFHIVVIKAQNNMTRNCSKTYISRFL